MIGTGGMCEGRQGGVMSDVIQQEEGAMRKVREHGNEASQQTCWEERG